MSLIFGSIPILISGFGQYLFNWYGPLEFLNGLIIWYQRENWNAGMTGLFNNANYTACALSYYFPFFMQLSSRIKILTTEKLINAIIIFLVIIGIFFTSSRNGLLSSFTRVHLFFLYL